MSSTQRHNMGQTQQDEGLEFSQSCLHRPPAIAQFTRRGIQDPAELLTVMQACRQTMLKVVTESRSRGPADQKAVQVIESLDDLVEELTGDRACLWKAGGQP